MNRLDEFFATHVQPQLNKIESGIIRIEDALNGNGSEGLKRKQARLEEQVAVLRKWKNWFIGILSSIAVSLIVTGIVLLWP